MSGGYTSFTQTRGDEAAARLATAFAEIAAEAIEARGGRVIELRGDEALAVFASARQALRAAVDLQLTLLDEIELNPSLPLRVGIGVDAGEAVRVGDGYRGGALNLAARLCSSAGPGEILASQGVAHLARTTDSLRFLERGSVEFKGLTEPVQVFQIIAAGLEADEVGRRLEAAERSAVPEQAIRPELPPELDPMTPLVVRDIDARWIRWVWRQARSGAGTRSSSAVPRGSARHASPRRLRRWQRRTAPGLRTHRALRPFRSFWQRSTASARGNSPLF